MPKKNKTPFQTTRAERLSYPLYFVGQNLFFILITTYLNTYLMDIGITALAISGLFLIIKIWDAVNDPIFGGLVDKLNLKSGKFLPWLRISVIAIPVTTLALFMIPTGLSPAVKLIWAGIAYVFWDTAYTICDVPIFGIVTTLSSQQAERSSILSYGRTAGVIAAMVVTVIFPSLRIAIGSWSVTVIILAVIGVAAMLPICFTAKERVKPIAAEEEIGLKDMFHALIKNKYLLIFYASFCLSQMTALGNSLSIIVARELFGNESVASQLTLMALLPTIVIGAVLPLILRKVDKYYLYFGAVALNSMLGILNFFVGYQNLNLYLLLLLLKGIPFGVTFILMFMFTPDCVEYGTYSSKISSPGVGFSVQTFSSKLAAAIAVSLGSFCLAQIGFISGEQAIQTAENFNNNLWLSYTLVPAAGGLLSLLVLSRYKLRDKFISVMAKANSGEITRQEAERLLAGKF